MAMHSFGTGGQFRRTEIFHPETVIRSRMALGVTNRSESGLPAGNVSRTGASLEKVAVAATLAMNSCGMAGPFQRKTSIHPRIVSRSRMPWSVMKRVLSGRLPLDNREKIAWRGSEGARPGLVNGNHKNAIDKSVSGLPSTKTFNWSSMAVFLGGALLASSFGLLSLCNPAFAQVTTTPEQPTTATTGTPKDHEEVIVEKSTQSRDSSDSQGTSETTEGRATKESYPSAGEDFGDAKDPVELLLKSYLEKHPTDKKALQALLFSRLKKGEVDASLTLLTQLVELEPENLHWKYLKAQTHDDAGHVDEARQGFEEILQSRPFSARAMQGLAYIMQRTGEVEEALQMLAEAVKKAVSADQPKEASNLRMLLGQMHTMQGNLDTALELYQTVAQEDPKDYRPYLCQGLVYSMIGEQKEAEKQFRQYRSLCPKDFALRGLLDELMLSAKRESLKLNEQLKREAEELHKKGRKPGKSMWQPLATGSTGVKDKD